MDVAIAIMPNPESLQNIRISFKQREDAIKYSTGGFPSNICPQGPLSSQPPQVRRM